MKAAGNKKAERILSAIGFLSTYLFFYSGFEIPCIPVHFRKIICAST